MGILNWLQSLIGEKAISPNTMQPVRALFYTGGDAPATAPVTKRQLVEAYEDTAFFCANLNSNGVARTPLRLFVRTSPGQPRPRCATEPITKQQRKYLRSSINSKFIRDTERVEEVIQHPAIDLLDSPLKDQFGRTIIDRFSLLDLTQLYLEIAGEGYWLIERNALGVPFSIQVIQPQNVTPNTITNSGNIVDFYQIETGNGLLDVSPEQLLAIKNNDPKDPYRVGRSPMEAAWRRIMVVRKMVAMTQSTLDNRARPDAIISPADNELGFSKPEEERLRNTFNGSFRGAGGGKVFINPTGVRVTPLQFSPKDIGEIMQEERYRDQIARAFDIPLSMLDKSKVSRANAEDGRTQHAKDAIWPRVCRFQSFLNTQYLPMFDQSGRLFFAFDDPVPENFERKLREREVNIRSGITTINMERGDEGRDPVDWGDRPWLPQNVFQPGLPGEEDEEDPNNQFDEEPEDDEEDEGEEDRPEDEDDEEQVEQVAFRSNGNGVNRIRELNNGVG